MLHLAGNDLPFFNSIKMKMSIIFGVLHMSFGIVLSLTNHRYFGDRYDALYTFPAQIIFLQAMFGYTSFMIIYKWLVPWCPGTGDPAVMGSGGIPGVPGSPYCDVSLISTLINMFLGAMGPGGEGCDPSKGESCYIWQGTTCPFSTASR